MTPKDRVIETITIIPHLTRESYSFSNKESNDWLFNKINEVMSLNKQKLRPHYIEFMKVKPDEKADHWCNIWKDGRVNLQRLANVEKDRLNVFSSIELAS